MEYLSMQAQYLLLRLKVITSRRLNLWVNIPNKDGKQLKVCIPYKKRLLKMVLSNAGIARLRKFSQPKVCWRKTATQLRRKSVRRFRECYAAVRDTSNLFKQFSKPPQI